MRRAVVGGCAVGLATGWNVANIGAIPSHLADSYDVSLAVVGLFTTALFVTHLAMQIPGGRAADRFGARRAALVGLAVIIVFNGLALVAPEPALAITARALIGIGTGLGFIAAARTCANRAGRPSRRASTAVWGSPAAGSRSPLSRGWTGGSVARAVLDGARRRRCRPRPAGHRAGGSSPASGPSASSTFPPGSCATGVSTGSPFFYGASLGLSLVVGNWVVELLERNGGVAKGTAGAVGAFTLLLGVLTRPLGGWILRERPAAMRASVVGALAAGAAGTALLATAEPLAVAALGAVLIGLAAGIPFAPAFTGAALARPDAPGAAVGMVNGAASLVVIVGTPLLGLTFRLPGDGRIGFVVVAVLWLVALALVPSQRDLGVRSAG